MACLCLLVKVLYKLIVQRHPSWKKDSASAAPGNTCILSYAPCASLSAITHDSRDIPVSRALSRKLVLCTRDSMAIRDAACLCGMLTRQRARRSASQFITTSIDGSSTYLSVPTIGTPITVTLPSPAMRTSSPSKGGASSAVGTFCFCGNHASMGGLAATTLVSCSPCRKQVNAFTVRVVAPIKPRETPFIHAKAHFPCPSNSFLKRLSLSRNQMESRCWTPLE